MNSCEWTAFITALANALSCNLSADEIDFFSALLVQFGDTLATISAQRALCENTKNNLNG